MLITSIQELLDNLENLEYLDKGGEWVTPKYSPSSLSVGLLQQHISDGRYRVASETITLQEVCSGIWVVATDVYTGRTLTGRINGRD